MAYDERLAERIRVALAGHREVTERKMFGGIAFMVGGNMCCGVVGEDLMVRVGPEAYEASLREAHTRPMDFTGRPMRGMVYVGSAGLRTKAQLGKWVERGAAYAESVEGKGKRKRGALKGAHVKQAVRPVRQAHRRLRQAPSARSGQVRTNGMSGGTR